MRTNYCAARRETIIIRKPGEKKTVSCLFFRLFTSSITIHGSRSMGHLRVQRVHSPHGRINIIAHMDAHTTFTGAQAPLVGKFAKYHGTAADRYKYDHTLGQTPSSSIQHRQLQHTVVQQWQLVGRFIKTTREESDPLCYFVFFSYHPACML